jgi:hypothetical protein
MQHLSMTNMQHLSMTDTRHPGYCYLQTGRTQPLQGSSTMSWRPTTSTAPGKHLRGRDHAILCPGALQATPRNPALAGGGALHWGAVLMFVALGGH